MDITWIFLGLNKLKILWGKWRNLSMTHYLKTLRNHWGFLVWWCYYAVFKKSQYCRDNTEIFMDEMTCCLRFASRLSLCGGDYLNKI